MIERINAVYLVYQGLFILRSRELIIAPEGPKDISRW
jgi:hypothetical protein